MQIKLILYGLLVLGIVALGTTAVLTYRRAIQQNAKLTVEVATWVAQDNITRTEVARLLEYQRGADKTNIQQRKRIAFLESLRSVRDAEGNIDPVNDNVLVLLNGMFGPAGNDSQAAHPPDNAALLR